MAFGVVAVLASCAAAPDLDPSQQVGAERSRSSAPGRFPSGTNATTTTSTTTSVPSTSTPTTSTPTPSAPPTSTPSDAVAPVDGLPTTFRAAGTRAAIGGCTMFPPDHFLNATDIDTLPVHPRSSVWLNSLGGANATMRFPNSRIWEGSRGGMPINVVDSRVTGFRNVVLSPWGSTRSYLGPYPIPDTPLVQGSPTAQWDRHVLTVDVADCTAYELIQYDPLVKALTGVHTAWIGMRYPLNTSDWPVMTTNAPKTPMLGQYVLLDEVRRGRVDHVIGFCTDDISTAHMWPARASDGRVESPDAMPMGTWIRLRADVDVSRFGAPAATVARALREHGAVLTDTCAHDFYLMGENSPEWDDAGLAALATLDAADFEVVDTTPLRADGTSFRIR